MFEEYFFNGLVVPLQVFYPLETHLFPVAVSATSAFIAVYLLASLAAVFLKVFETLYVGMAHEREDDPHQAARHMCRLSRRAPVVLLAALLARLWVPGTTVTALMRPLGLPARMTLLRDDPALCICPGAAGPYFHDRTEQR